MASAAIPHVLVVDDEEEITYIFERYLSFAGYDVSVANNGDEALRTFRVRGADLVITDFRMPGMNGAELIAQLRGVVPGLPALVISANPVDMGTMPDGVRFFAKPVTMPDLLERVAQLTA